MGQFSRKAIIVCVCVALSACADTSVMQMDANTVAISVSAAPACSALAAQRLAYRDAAIETLQQGYDRFVIMAGGGAAEVAGVAYAPTVVTTSSAGTGSTAFASGGFPVFLTRHQQELTVRMFHDNAPGAADAVPAKSVLGTDWQEKLAAGFPSTC